MHRIFRVCLELAPEWNFWRIFHYWGGQGLNTFTGQMDHLVMQHLIKINRIYALSLGIASIKFGREQFNFIALLCFIDFDRKDRKVVVSNKMKLKSIGVCVHAFPYDA